MDTNYAERHIRALRLAKDCVALGARRRTIEHITGLAHGDIRRFFFRDSSSAPRGRRPDSPDWYHRANLLKRVEASMFVSIYRRIRGLGFSPAEALVSGYKHYRQICSSRARINFDRAFDLASHVDGLWVARVRNLSLLTCSICTSEYVTSPGAPSISQECPFCKLVKRYEREARIQNAFPLRALPDVSNMRLGVFALTRAITDN